MRNGFMFFWSALLSASLYAQNSQINVRSGVFRDINSDATGLNLGADMLLGDRASRYFLSYDHLEEFVIFSEPAQVNVFSAGIALVKQGDKGSFTFLIGPSYVRGYRSADPGEVQRSRIKGFSGIIRAGYKWNLGEHLSMGMSAGFFPTGRGYRYLSFGTEFGFRF